MKPFIFSLFSLFFILSLNTAQAQNTAAGWIKKAEAAEAKGDWSEAGAARSSAARLQAANGDHEKAADNYRRAGEHFDRDGRPAQANAEQTNAATSYERAAEAESDKGNHKKAADLYDQAAEQYDDAGLAAMAEGARRKAAAERQQTGAIEGPQKVVMKATGMKQTTGHIATLEIFNPTDEVYTLPAGNYYLPQHKGTQSFAAYLESPVTVAPGHSATAPVLGNCTNLFAPPPGFNEPTAPVETWYYVTENPMTDPRHPFRTTTPLDESWSPTTANGWQVLPPREDVVVLTVPGTDIPMNAYLEPGRSPEEEARYHVTVATLVREEVQEMAARGDLPLVISQNQDVNVEGITQQVLWMVSASAQGKVYTYDQFSGNIDREYEKNRGKKLSQESPDLQEAIAEKAEAAWEAFTFVGASAKVLQDDTQAGPVFQANDEEEADDCALTRAGMTLRVSLKGKKVGNREAIDTTFRLTVREAAGDNELDIFIGDNRLIRRGDTVAITITSPFIECDCEDGDCDPDEVTYLEGPGGRDVYHISDDPDEDDFHEDNMDEDGATFGGRGGDLVYTTRFISRGRMANTYPGIRFQLRTTCRSNDCGSAEVIQKFQIKIR